MLNSRLFATLFCLLCLFSACKKSERHAISYSEQVDIHSKATPVKNDWLVLWLAANPEILNPIISSDGYANDVMGNIFESLISYDAMTGEPYGRLAESWTVSEDGLTYDFKLRKNVKFHDGRPMTAADVKFSFDAIKNPKVDAAHLRNYYSGIDRLEVMDPHHVRFHVKTIYFRNLIIMGLMDIIPKHIYGKGDFNKNPANRKPLGTGPYVFSKWDNGRVIELERSKNYWGLEVDKFKDRYNFNRIVYRIINEQNVAAMGLKKGDIDVMEPTITQFTKELTGPEVDEKFYKIRYSTEDGAGYRYIGWNLKNPILSSKKIRHALAHAMPREEINKKVFENFSDLSVGPFPRKSPKADPHIVPIPYDIHKAKSILSEEGWGDSDKDQILDKNGAKFSIELLYPSGSAEGDRMALIYQQSLKNLGIELRLRTLEWTVFLQQLQAAKFDAVMLSWLSALDMDPYQIWHSSQAASGGSNRISYKNQRVDELLETARITLDREKRNQMYQEFSRIIADDAPYLFLFERPALLVVSKRFARVFPVGKMGLDSSKWFTPSGLEKYRDAE